MTNGSILQEDITVLHRFVPNSRTSKHMGLIWMFGWGAEVTSSQTLGLPSVRGERKSQLRCHVCPHLSAQLRRHLAANDLHLPMSLVETPRIPEREGCVVHPTPPILRTQVWAWTEDMGTDPRGGEWTPGMGGPGSPEHHGGGGWKDGG